MERGTLLTNILKDKDHKEGCDQVIDALDVAAGRVANGPDEEDPLKNLTHIQTNTDLVSEQQRADKKKAI